MFVVLLEVNSTKRLFLSSYSLIPLLQFCKKYIASKEHKNITCIVVAVCSNLKTLQGEMESCEAEKNALSDENEELKGDVEKKTEEIHECDEENSELRDKNTELSGELATRTQEIERLKKEIESLKPPSKT